MTMTFSNVEETKQEYSSLAKKIERVKISDLEKIKNKLGNTDALNILLDDLNKKYNIDKNHELFLSTYVRLAVTKQFSKIEKYMEYLVYLVQKKLGLVKGGIPGADKVERELGLK